MRSYIGFGTPVDETVGKKHLTLFDEDGDILLSFRELFDPQFLWSRIIAN